LKGVTDHLENERRRIYEEIGNYPAPIPACDAQFNFLLEERAGIVQELYRLKALPKDVKSLDDFIISSDYIKGAAEQNMRSTLRQASREDEIETKS
jgi:hypothetical protein